MDRRRPVRWIRNCAAWLSDPYREYDRRRNLRLPADLEAEVTVPLGVLSGRTVDLSRGGASVRLSEPIALQTIVFIRFPTVDRSGFASVRRCSAREDGYEVALQFRDGLALEDRTMANFDYHRIRADGAWSEDA